MSAQKELTGTWSIDPTHSRVGFSSRHAMVTKVRGAFNDVSGTAQLDAEDMSRSKVSVVLSVDSVDTRSPQRDAHLRSADFFDAQQHPTIEFDSTAVDEVDENQFIVTGELTIRGVTRTISVPLELLGVDTDPFGQLRAGLEGSRRIDRKDWGVSWNTPLDSGGVLVSDKITLEFELSLVKDAPAGADSAPQG
ncbi:MULTISPECIES: YceI family protein [Kocuria]|uniref:YceI family protein n=1 Tax=Kocuria TaxID=57493 RepID=UPI000738E1AE|nr:MULTISPECIES: YceI family protein [Kocuria]KUG55184.1 polyisoprenoid-binding protein [Kocuria palustris]MCT1590426.1 YceI family protein [Kocuria palustris]